MKTKIQVIPLILLVLSVCLSLNACQLAVPAATSRMPEKSLIGVAIEILDKVPPGPKGNSEYVYAEKKESEFFGMPHYEFPGGNIIACCMIEYETPQGKERINDTGEGLVDLNMAVNVTDEGESQSLTASLYAAEGFDGVFVLRTLFQSGEGIYFVRSNTDEAVYASQLSLDSFTSRSVESKLQDEDGGVIDYAVTVNFGKRTASKTVAILQMDDDNAVLSREEYACHALPAEIVLLTGTEYIIAETTGQGKTTREIIKPEYGSAWYTVYYDSGAICMPKAVNFKEAA